MVLTLIRHAVTAWNTAGRVQGQSDVPLSALGEAQAVALGERVSGEFTGRFSSESSGEKVLLYSSPLGRARTTAALAFPEFTPTIDPRLSELNFGIFEGLTLAERRALPQWHDWIRKPFAEPAPGGESYGELCGRAAAWLESLPDAPHVVAVTHSGTIQTLVAHILQMDTKSWRKRLYLGHASVTRFVGNGSEFMLERLNDTQHLSAELQTKPSPPEAVQLDR